MMKNSRSFFLRATIVLGTTALLASCSGTDEAEDITADTTAVATEAPKKTEVYYQIPAPSELLDFLKGTGKKGKGTAFLNPVENRANYTDQKAKALNFGVYATDLLYASTFDYGADAVKYFAAVKKLSDELGISSAVDENIRTRIEKNMSAHDSLTTIANDVYFAVIDDLESNDQGKTLSLLVAGGWIEGMYLLTKYADKYDPKSPAVERLADQKYSLENLMDMMKKYESDAGVSDMLSSLNQLNDIYAASGATGAENEGVITKKGDKRVLGGGETSAITADQFNKLTAKIIEIRNSITAAKS